MRPEIAEVLAGSRLWCVVHGNCLDEMAALPELSIDHCLTDPPYSAKTHAAAAAAARDLPDGAKRKVYASGANGFGFECLAPTERAEVAALLARSVRRWCLTFTDQEGVGPWIDAAEGAGLQHVRVGQWIKIGAVPQFSGDRPGQGCEAVEIFHRKGRKRWNGGGRSAVWTHPIAAIEAKTSRSGAPEHVTPKPVSLMLELASLFTDPGDVVLDPFAGSGTTGVACLRLGRRFIGMERDAKYAGIATERLEAEVRGLSLRDARAGQTSIFDMVTP